MELGKIEYFCDYEQINEVDILVSKYINEKITINEFSKAFYEQYDSEAGAKCKLQHKTLRLIQSLINLLDTEELLNIEKYRLLLSIKNKSERFDIDQLLSLIDPFVNPELDEFDQFWIKHRNVCFTLVIVLRFLQLHRDKQVFVANELETYSQIMEYLVRIILQSENVETKLYAVTATLNLCLLFIDHRKQLTDCDTLYALLENMAIKEDDGCPLESLYSGTAQCIQYQTAFQAFWCLDLLSTAPGKRPEAQLKLSPNKLSVRNDELFNLPSIHCPLSVNSDVFFYEVVLLTSGEMRLGWISGNSSSNSLGTDLYSVGLDGYNRRLWHNQVDQPVRSMNRWACGDVIGVLIDFNLESFSFYHNGEKVDLGEVKIHFSSLPYFASVSLAVNQQCYFNFGQASFKYPPANYQFQNFYSTSQGALQAMDPLVLETKLIAVNWHALKGFRDDFQKEYTKLVALIESFVAKNVIRKGSKDLESLFHKLFQLPTGFHRLLQSFIEEVGDKVENHQIDCIMQWFVLSINPLIAIELKAKRNSYSRLGSYHITRIKAEYPLMNIFNSYISKELPDIQKCNFFMMLSFLTQINFCLVFQDKWINEILHYAINTLIEGVFSCDLHVSSQLFLIISIENLTAILNKTTEVEKRSELLNTLKVLSEKSQHYQVYDKRKVNTRSYTELQVSFCADYFLRKLTTFQQQQQQQQTEGALTSLFEGECSTPSSPSPTPSTPPLAKFSATLNAADSTANLKVSADCLSIRNDHYDSHYWQSVRSTVGVHCQDVYYYEVTLLTSGRMRIGWATANSSLEKVAAIGDDEFSIGFDGFAGTVSNDTVQYEVGGLKSRWMPGDVVGCLINCAKRKFTFYLNGEKMKYRKGGLSFKTVYFSSQPYYAAVSLFIHQQCAVNFGQEPFRNPPKRVDYQDFHRTFTQQVSRATKLPVRVSYSIKEGNLCGLCKINDAAFKFCKCDHWELCSKCVPKLTDCPICGN